MKYSGKAFTKARPAPAGQRPPRVAGPHRQRGDGNHQQVGAGSQPPQPQRRGDDGRSARGIAGQRPRGPDAHAQVRADGQHGRGRERELIAAEAGDPQRGRGHQHQQQAAGLLDRDRNGLDDRVGDGEPSLVAKRGGRGNFPHGQRAALWDDASREAGRRGHDLHGGSSRRRHVHRASGRRADRDARGPDDEVVLIGNRAVAPELADRWAGRLHIAGARRRYVWMQRDAARLLESDGRRPGAVPQLPGAAGVALPVRDGRARPGHLPDAAVLHAGQARGHGAPAARRDPGRGGRGHRVGGVAR